MTLWPWAPFLDLKWFLSLASDQPKNWAASRISPCICKPLGWTWCQPRTWVITATGTNPQKVISFEPPTDHLPRLPAAFLCPLCLHEGLGFSAPHLWWTTRIPHWGPIVPNDWFFSSSLPYTNPEAFSDWHWTCFQEIHMTRKTKHTTHPTRWAHVQRLQTIRGKLWWRESKRIQAGELALLERPDLTPGWLPLKWLWW